MRLYNTSFLDEPSHKLCIIPIHGWSRNLKSFMQMIADVITNPHSNFLVLRLVMDLCRKSAILQCIID